MKYATVFAASIFLASCAVNPSVQYNVISSPTDMDGLSDSFYLRATTLEVSATNQKRKNAQGDEVIITKISIMPKATEHRERRFGVGGKRNFFSNTTVNLTKVDNTSLVNSIGVETEDTAVSAIEQGGGIIASLVSAFVGFGAAGSTNCVEEKSGTLKFPLDPSADEQEFNGARPNCISIKYGELPSDAIPVGDLPLLQKTSNYYFSACRPATVTVEQSDGKMLVEQIVVNDPRYVQYVRLPSKGKVDHHSVCGVSVVTEGSVVRNPADIVRALEAQGNAIRDALQAAGGGDDSDD